MENTSFKLISSFSDTDKEKYNKLLENVVSFLCSKFKDFLYYSKPVYLYDNPELKKISTTSIVSENIILIDYDYFKKVSFKDNPMNIISEDMFINFSHKNGQKEKKNYTIHGAKAYIHKLFKNDPSVDFVYLTDKELLSKQPEIIKFIKPDLKKFYDETIMFINDDIPSFVNSYKETSFNPVDKNRDDVLLNEFAEKLTNEIIEKKSPFANVLLTELSICNEEKNISSLNTTLCEEVAIKIINNPAFKKLDDQNFNSLRKTIIENISGYNMILSHNNTYIDIEKSENNKKKLKP